MPTHVESSSSPRCRHTPCEEKNWLWRCLSSFCWLWWVQSNAQEVYSMAEARQEECRLAKPCSEVEPAPSIAECFGWVTLWVLFLGLPECESHRGCAWSLDNVSDSHEVLLASSHWENQPPALLSAIQKESWGCQAKQEERKDPSQRRVRNSVVCLLGG